VAAGQGNPGVYLLRAKALVSGDLKQVELIPGKTYVPGNITATPAKFGKSDRMVDTHNYGTMGLISNADSSTLLGYNVYRKNDVNAQFLLRNSAPVTGTSYIDTMATQPPVGTVISWYVTALFQNSQNLNTA